MRVRGKNRRALNSIKSVLRVRAAFVIALLLSLTAFWSPANAQQPDTAIVAESAPLSADQVVQKLVQMNLNRAQALHAYQGTRIYRAEYQGFPGTRTAEMVVDVKYLSPGSKEFTIRSSTGSELIIDRVFKKLLQAEKEALDPEIQRRSALSNENYRFTFIGYERGCTGATYVLEVEPRTKDKFLYRGRIWVDARDFAVVRLEAKPAKNPSFWTKRAEVVQVYKKVNDFWLPAHNRSVSAIRLGGQAALTIDYVEYQVTGASGVPDMLMLESTRSSDTSEVP